jgi:predicted tellurium resistance membrane protein TerC
LEFFAPLATTEGWITFATLLFLEMVLGIDNLVFISITTNRLPEEKQHLGRRIGLLAALIMRVILLCFAAWIVHMTQILFTLPFDIPLVDPDVNARDLVLFLGGAYLIYKGIIEIKEKVSWDEVRAHNVPAEKHNIKRISMPRAVGTIMIMDIVFSLDSVITAVGLSGELIIMILAVMIAVFIMIIFADVIANFINRNPEMKILALIFIVAVGVKLVVEAMGIHIAVEGSGADVLDLMLYFAMLFSLIITCIQMFYNHRVKKVQKEAEENEQ